MGFLDGVARLIAAVFLFILALGILASCAPAQIFDRSLSVKVNKVN